MSYQLLLTNAGAQILANAAVNGGDMVQITDFVVGQGIDVDFSQRLDKQTLVSKRYQGKIDGIAPAAQPHTYEVSCVVPYDVGGFAIREFGLLDANGVLIWVGALPEVVKPAANTNTAVDYRIKAVIRVDNPDVTIVVDVNVMTVTRAYADTTFLPRAALEVFYPIGCKYWTHSDVNPKPQFDLLFGKETFWRRLHGVQLVSVEDGDPQINQPSMYVGKNGDVSADISTPDHYQLYTGYLWERYDPHTVLVRYDGLLNFDGTATFG